MAMAIQPPALLRAQPLQKRLWQIGGLLAIWTLIVGGANLVLPADKAVTPAMLGHDFLPFYMAGTFAREGRVDQLYDLNIARQWQQALAAEHGLVLGNTFGPWWNPPHFAWMFAPYSMLPYRLALAAWTMTGVLCLAISIVLLVRLLPRREDDRAPDWRTWGLVPLLILCSMPFVQAISHGQNTFLSLLLLSGTVVLWRGNRAIGAGLVCGLLFYKPQLATLVSAVMLLTMGPRVLIGLGLTGCAIGAVTALTMPTALLTFVQQVPANLVNFQIDNAYMWERHVTLAAFWRLLLQGYQTGPATLPVTMLTAASVALLIMGLLTAIWRQARMDRPDTPWHLDTRSMRRARLIAATIIISPLLMPFYFDYDLLLLAVPAVLIARPRVLMGDGRPASGLHRCVGVAFGLLVVAMVFNPGMGRATGVNIGVIALMLLGALSIRLAVPRRPALITDVQFPVRALPVTLRQAA
ncbi:MAG TPA: glycosyltransferase family 87 protein [Tepidisphaeraceae bacterium]|nr:glycosyltransferase family 87 protein [Tepidisphaeraceae bacterium]